MSFKEGKIIETFKSKDGRKIVIRYPAFSDARGAMDYVNSLVEERAMIAWTKKITLKKEKEYFKKIIKEIKNKDGIFLIAEVDGRFAGMGDVGLRSFDVQKHIADLGIGIRKEYRGLGIAKRIMINMEKISKRDLKSEILMLSVFNKNRDAISLYKKLGFKEVGKIPNGIKQHGKYDTDIIMYKVLKK